MANTSTQGKLDLIHSPSQLQYSLVTDHTSYISNEYFKQAYQLIRECPKDLLQLKEPMEYFAFSYRIVLRKSIDLYTLPGELFNRPMAQAAGAFMAYSSEFNRDIAKVFLIDPAITVHEQLGGMIQQLPFCYFHITGELDAEVVKHYDMARHFSNAHELIGLLRQDLPKLNEQIKKSYGLEIADFYFGETDATDKLNPNYWTDLAETNYYTLNQVLANFWRKRPKEKSKEDVKLFTDTRVEYQLSQISQLDALHFTIGDKKKVTPIEPSTPSLIVSAPYHFPRHKKLLAKEFKTKKEKNMFRIYQTEQSLDYSFGIEEDLVAYFKKEEIGHLLGAQAQKLKSLDDIAYLHAQFQYSPAFRLPVAGKSLNMDLSHFQQKFSNKKEAIKKISVIGEAMKARLIDDRFAELLRKRDGQLVFISDLPMEWVKLGEFPLCLTHDICRIPEFNTNSLLNNFVHNQRFSFTIRPDILSRTLVIHCASDDEGDMHTLFKLIDDYQPQLGFHSAICSTVEEIAEQVRKFNPDLLIFDCHGDFDPDTLSSFLVVDDRNDVLLTGEDIIRERISAPLVFISACSTMPNYGYVKFLSDAFFQAGAYAVTATFLPIQMGEAAKLVIRLLTNLKQQESKVIHHNWLSYIAQILRSVMIHETIRKEQLSGKLPATIDHHKISEILTEMMVFQGREKAFGKLKTYLQTFDPSIDTGFENLDHEWLSYTTIGRADLIYFENWAKAHRELHLGEGANNHFNNP